MEEIVNFFNLLTRNLLTIPIFAFIIGILTSVARPRISFYENFKSFLTYFLLFSIGLKGGSSLMEQLNYRIFSILALLIAWGFIQPFFSYIILKRFTKIDSATAAAVAACFGSISVMTYIAGAAFLEKLGISYDGLVATAIAIMEFPAIISGLIVYKIFNHSIGDQKNHLLKEAIFNKTIFIIFLGMIFGIILKIFELNLIQFSILLFFKPFLCLFLFSMGLIVGKNRHQLKQFSWSLSLFGLYMPLIGAAFGMVLSYFLRLNVGTGTLIAVLTASASYIAVPAAMRTMLSEAKETIYLPLSLGITFPFNVLVGIPIYYQLASKILN